jgi:hypothetical protein
VSSMFSSFFPPFLIFILINIICILLFIRVKKEKG